MRFSPYAPGFIARMLLPLIAYMYWLGPLFRFLVWHVGPFAIPAVIVAAFLVVMVGAMAAEDYVDRKVDEEFSRLIDSAADLQSE